MLYGAVFSEYLSHLKLTWKLILSYVLIDQAFAVSNTYFKNNINIVPKKKTEKCGKACLGKCYSEKYFCQSSPIKINFSLNCFFKKRLTSDINTLQHSYIEKMSLHESYTFLTYYNFAEK